MSNVNTDRCSDCTCYLRETCFAGFPPPSVGDGFCNDETNNVHCYYDGLDCCRSPVNTELCSNCTCHGELKTFYSCLYLAYVVSTEGFLLEIYFNPLEQSFSSPDADARKKLDMDKDMLEALSCQGVALPEIELPPSVGWLKVKWRN